METKAVELLSNSAELTAVVLVALAAASWFAYKKLVSTIDKIKKFFNESIDSLRSYVDEKFNETKTFHNEAMQRIDNLSNSVVATKQTMAVQGKELEYGDKRFDEMGAQIQSLHKDNKAIREHLHTIRGSMITARQLEILLKDE